MKKNVCLHDLKRYVKAIRKISACKAKRKRLERQVLDVIKDSQDADATRLELNNSSKEIIEWRRFNSWMHQFSSSSDHFKVRGCKLDIAAQKLSKLTGRDISVDVVKNFSSGRTFIPEFVMEVIKK